MILLSVEKIVSTRQDNKKIELQYSPGKVVTGSFPFRFLLVSFKTSISDSLLDTAVGRKDSVNETR
jgi:hypothetical protein